jgi:hypothetical protein
LKELFAATQFAMEPGTREAPVTADGGHRHLEHVGRFLQTQPAEEASFDDAALALV